MPGADQQDMSNSIIFWNSIVLDVLRDTGARPPEASRAIAMVHVAMHEAAAYKTLAAGQDHSNAACSVAAHIVLTHLFPTQSRVFDSALGAALPDRSSPSTESGMSLGRSAADAVLEWREHDHSDEAVPYVPQDRPGAWKPTPPGYEEAYAPNWPMVTPFAIGSTSQFRSAGHPPLTSPEYAAAFDNTKSLGSKTSQFRTDEQTEIAHFWADGAGTVVLWNLIAQQVAASKPVSLLDTAHLFALLNVALADAVIAAWDDKYYFNLWRPVSAIREADGDGNPLTEADPAWEPLDATKPEPEHTSAHCAVSGAAARILELFSGCDDFSFALTSVNSPRITRSYRSFSQAAAEAAQSRIYAGLHFEFSTNSGLDKGKAIADHVWRNGLRPHDGRISSAGLVDGMAAAVSENHRRGITVTLTILDEALCEVEQWANGRELHSVFYNERNRLQAWQRQEILSEIAQMRIQLQELKETLHLEPRVEDAGTAIRGRCSGLWEHIVELKAKHLRRYGDVPSELGDYIDPKAEQLIQRILRILETLKRRRPNDGDGPVQTKE